MTMMISETSLPYRQPLQVHEDISGNHSAFHDTLDFLCVGFTLPALSIAVSLADSRPDAKVCFLERERSFNWTPAKNLSENRIRTPFLRDLITSHNPRSQFTFINYLHATNQLVQYANASNLRPSKALMSLYLEWVARHINEKGWVNYNQEVVGIRPVKPSAAGRVSSWEVRVRNPATGDQVVRTVKRIVVACDSAPYLPPALSDPTLAPQVVHTDMSEQICSDTRGKHLNIAIVGGTQAAAELFAQLQSIYGDHRVTLFIKDSALRPADATPFARSAVDAPDRSAAALPPQWRQKLIFGDAKSTTVDLELIEKIYDNMYAQKVTEADPRQRRFQIEPLAEVVGVQKLDVAEPRVRLQLQNPRTGAIRACEHSFDLVVAATGHRGRGVPFASSITPILDSGRLSVDRNYSVNMKRGTLEDDCGLWMVNLPEAQMTEDDCFLHIAEQAHRVTQSVYEKIIHNTGEQDKVYGQISML